MMKIKILLFISFLAIGCKTSDKNQIIRNKEFFFKANKTDFNNLTQYIISKDTSSSNMEIAIEIPLKEGMPISFFKKVKIKDQYGFVFTEDLFEIDARFWEKTKKLNITRISITKDYIEYLPMFDNSPNYSVNYIFSKTGNNLFENEDLLLKNSKAGRVNEWLYKLNENWYIHAKPLPDSFYIGK